MIDGVHDAFLIPVAGSTVPTLIGMPALTAVGATLSSPLIVPPVIRYTTASLATSFLTLRSALGWLRPSLGTFGGAQADIRDLRRGFVARFRFTTTVQHMSGGRFFLGMTSCNAAGVNAALTNVKVETNVNNVIGIEYDFGPPNTFRFISKGPSGGNASRDIVFMDEAGEVLPATGLNNPWGGNVTFELTVASYISEPVFEDDILSTFKNSYFMSIKRHYLINNTLPFVSEDVFNLSDRSPNIGFTGAPDPELPIAMNCILSTDGNATAQSFELMGVSFKSLFVDRPTILTL